MLHDLSELPDPAELQALRSAINTAEAAYQAALSAAPADQDALDAAWEKVRTALAAYDDYVQLFAGKLG